MNETAIISRIVLYEVPNEERDATILRAVNAVKDRARQYDRPQLEAMMDAAEQIRNLRKEKNKLDAEAQHLHIEEGKLKSLTDDLDDLRARESKATSAAKRYQKERNHARKDLVNLQQEKTIWESNRSETGEKSVYKTQIEGLLAEKASWRAQELEMESIRTLKNNYWGSLVILEQQRELQRKELDAERATLMNLQVGIARDTTIISTLRSDIEKLRNQLENTGKDAEAAKDRYRKLEEYLRKTFLQDDDDARSQAVTSLEQDIHSQPTPEQRCVKDLRIALLRHGSYLIDREKAIQYYKQALAEMFATMRRRQAGIAAT